MNIIQLRRSRLVKLLAALAIIGLVFYATNGTSSGKSPSVPDSPKVAIFLKFEPISLCAYSYFTEGGTVECEEDYITSE